MLWDTAGQEEFDAITAAYYRGAHACVLAYSATDRDSFDAIPSWKLKVRVQRVGTMPEENFIITPISRNFLLYSFVKFKKKNCLNIFFKKLFFQEKISCNPTYL